ncbi:MAG: peptidylprolyl isomerase [Polyangia bacterium]|jgi:peptidyl-prolyl cis-trans isomerase C|nr:peptidylprolyl isomerase [Polyangia bacterium]
MLRMSLGYFVAAAWLGLAGLGGCKKAPEQPPEGPKTKAGQASPSQPVPTLSPEERKIVLAEVNGEAITLGDFHDRIHRQSVFNRRRYTQLDRKKQYLEREFIMPVLEYAEARQKGLDKDDYVQKTLKNLMVSKLMRQLRTEFKTDEPTEAELKAFYEKHKDDYNQPELVRASHILVKTKVEADKVMAEVKGKSRVEFRKLVQQHSLDESSKARAGDLRYFDRQGKVRGMAEGTMGSVPKPIVDAVWDVKKPGDVVGPVQTPGGWHVVYFTGRRPARQRDFDQSRLHVKKRVMRDKWQEQKQAFIEKLKKEFGVVAPTGAEADKRLELVKVDLTTPEAQPDHGPGLMPPLDHGDPDGHGHGHPHGDHGHP